jgi:hypothetical protein
VELNSYYTMRLYELTRRLDRLEQILSILQRDAWLAGSTITDEVRLEIKTTREKLNSLTKEEYDKTKSKSSEPPLSFNPS